jgi:hypothetical protein
MKKLKILMFDMILHFKFIYNPEKNTTMIVQTIHLIMFSPPCIHCHERNIRNGYPRVNGMCAHTSKEACN